MRVQRHYLEYELFYPKYEPYRGSSDKAMNVVLPAHVAHVRQEAIGRGVDVQLVRRRQVKNFDPLFVRTALYLNDVLCRIHRASSCGYPERFASVCVGLNLADPRIEIFVVLIATKELEDERLIYLIPRDALKKGRVYLPFRADHGGFGQNVLKKFCGDWSIIGVEEPKG